jgi:hypothetical protein
VELLFVPWWLNKAFKDNHLSESKLLDSATLRRICSDKDLLSYATVNALSSNIIKRMYPLYFRNISLDVVTPTTPINFPETVDVSSTTNLYDHENDYRWIEEHCVGLTLPQDAKIALTAKLLPNTDRNTDLMGIFVSVVEKEEASATLDCEKQFLKSFVEVLYANNVPLKALAASGLLGAYIRSL